MPKPESRDTGAPIQWFTASKPTKKDKGNWARQNEAAYNKANEQIMLWRAQYQRDFGRGVPSYASGRDIPPEEKTPYNMALKEVLDKEAMKKAKRDAKKIDETKATPTGHEKTQGLKDKYAKQTADIASAKEQAGGKAIVEIPGVTEKPKHKNWLEKVGGVAADVSNALGRQMYGDAAGKMLEIIGRPGQATVGALTGLVNHPWAGVADPETVAEAEKRIGKPLSDTQKAVIEDIKKKWDKTHSQSIWHRALTGLEGKQKYSFVDNLEADALRQNEYDPKQISGAMKLFNVGTGSFAMDMFYDPTNVVGVGTVQKGVKALKGVEEGVKAGKVIRTAPEVISGAKAAGHEFEAGKAAAEFAQKMKAPLELEQFSQSTRAAQQAKQASKGFEFTNEAQHAARAAEVAQEAQKTQKITDATDAGYKALQKEARKAALDVSKAKGKAKNIVASSFDPMETHGIPGLVAKHEELLARVAEADNFRATAEILPVGGKVADLEKRVTRLGRLIQNAPENKQLVARLEKASKELKAARLAAIPEHADRIATAASKLAAGEKIVKSEIDSIAQAPPKLQDQLVAMAKAGEEMPGKAVGAETVTKAGKATKTTDKTLKEIAELPSTRIAARVDEEAQKAMSFAASDETIAQAGALGLDETVDDVAHRIASKMFDEAKLRNRKLTRGTAKAKIAKELDVLGQTEPFTEAAYASAGRKLAEMKKPGGKLIGGVTREGLFEESVLEELIPIKESLEKMVEEGMGKRFAFRVAKRDLGEIQPIGRILTGAHVPFEVVGKIARKVPGAEGAGETFAKAFRIGAHFEGETNYLRQMAENHGTVAQKAWANRVNETFKGISRSQARQITHAIEDGVILEDPRMEAWRQAAIAMRDEIFTKQTEMGKYVPAQKAENYVYHFYHSRNKKAIKDMKAARLGDIKSGIKGPTLETAAQKGLKPEVDIDKILMLQHRDLVSEMQRMNFRQQMMDNFGVLTDNAAFAHGVGLNEVSVKSLPRMFQDTAAAKKAAYYLPPELHETFKAMDTMLGIGYNPETEKFLNGFDSLVRYYKTSTTIANPGNWINNTVGDFFLNWVDGLHNPLWYEKSMRALAGGYDAPKTIAIAGSTQKTDNLLRMFRDKAPSGGFIGTEGTGPLSRFGTHGVKGTPTRWGKKVQGAYENREEWVRFAHFMHATDDEARKLIRAGHGKTFDDVADVATELAAKRVAKWNIDYTELTPFERKIRKRYVPFYTFVRKATPLMLEGMITRPGKMNRYMKAQRGIEKFLGVPAPEDDGTVWPEWTKEQGITRLTGGDEPNYLRDPTPLNVINRITTGTNYSSPFANVGNMASPLIKLGVEGITRRSLYNERPIDNWNAWWANQIPQLSMIQRLRGHPLSPQKPSGGTAVDSSKGTAGTSILERLSVFGLPVGKMSEARQQSALHTKINKDKSYYSDAKKAVEAQTGNKISDGGSVSGKNGKYYIVKDKDGNLVGKYRDFTQALLVASGSEQP